MDAIYIDALRWFLYLVMAACAAGAIYVILIVPTVMMGLAGGVLSNKEED